MQSYTINRDGQPIARRSGTRAAVAALAIAVVFSAACADEETAPQAALGPDALTVELTVTPTTATRGQAITFRATVKNPGSTPVVARYGTFACGAEIVVVKAGNEPYSTIAKPCPTPTDAAQDTLPPGDGVTFATFLPNVPAGTYQAYARFNAANGQAPNSATTTFVVQP